MISIRALTAAAVLCMPTLSSALDAGVSVSIGEPGFYGRLDIGRFPAPQLIYPQPVIIQPAPVAVVAPPLYLHVPPGHIKKWSKHCHRYNACGQPVYFVQDSWYDNVYVPAYAERHGKGHHDDHDHEQHHDHHDHDKGGHHGRGRGHDD